MEQRAKDGKVGKAISEKLCVKVSTWHHPVAARRLVAARRSLSVAGASGEGGVLCLDYAKDYSVLIQLSGEN